MLPLPIDLPSWLVPLLDQPNTRMAVVMLVVAAVLVVAIRPTTARARRPELDGADPKQLPRAGGPGFLERRKHEKPLQVAGVRFDRAWRHVGIVATTGARKSTLLAMLAEQLQVPFVVITGDHAPPLENLVRSRGGYVWKPRGQLPWYPWGGPLEHAVQRAEHMHPATSSDVGVHRAGFKQAARRAWNMADLAGEPRQIGQVLVAMKALIRGQSTATMVENWTLRIREIEESLGSSLGPGLDIVEALGSGVDVMVSLNSFQDPSNRQRFAAIAVLEALRAADTLGNIGVVIDEVGLVGADLFGDAVRTFRVRHVTGLFASQIADDFPPEVRGNVNVWFLGQQSGGDKRSRQWSSDCTFGLIPAEHFGEHALPQGEFVVVAGGRVQRAKVPVWKPRLERPAPPIDVLAGAYPEDAAAYRAEGCGYSVVEVLKGRTGLLMLPSPRGRESEPLRRAMAKYLYRDGECERWHGKHDRKGYGQVWLNGEWDYIHIVRWEAAHGAIERDEDGHRILTVDHDASCPKDCSRVSHFAGLVTRAENTARRWRRQGVRAK